MTVAKVNTYKLQQAILEFGSLHESINRLEIRKKELTDIVSTLERDVEGKKEIKEEYQKELEQLDRSIKECTEELNKIIDNINAYARQYRFFESFMAMMLTSPSKEESIEDLATEIFKWSKVKWKSDLPPEKLRFLFVHAVLGKHLHSLRCNNINCGAGLLVNRSPIYDFIRYKCPVCGLSSVSADDSFLKAMVGEYKIDEKDGN